MPDPQVEQLRRALGNFLAWYDRRFSGGQPPPPGLTLRGIAEEARAALSLEPPDPDDA